MKHTYRSITLLSLVFVMIFLAASSSVFAQEATPEADPLPTAHMLTGFTYEAQGWNNCGPATLTMALTYFGYGDNQLRAANWLKPNGEDKNVSPWQMLAYVNTQVPELPVFVLQRYGGTIETIKTLLYHGFPIVIEAGYDPASAHQGWMGHYLLVVGYDDDREAVTTYDSYDGQGMRYSYQHIEDYWQHFNYTYLVLYSLDRQAELMEILGDNADEYTNLINTLQIAQAEATEDQLDAHAWFNLGSSLALLAENLGEPTYYGQAAMAYDNARNLGLPWRMTWYQFGIYEAYLAAGRYQDVLDLVTATLNDGGGQYVEESYYYAGIAREMLGDNERAINNYNTVLNFNPNFAPARERRDALLTGS